MTKIIKKNDWIKLLVALFLLVLCDNLIRINNSTSKVVKKIDCSINEIQHTHDSISKLSPEILSTCKNENLTILIFENDSLVFWSSNTNEPSTLLKISSEKNIIQQGNTVFFISYSKNDSIKIFLSTPLYHDNANYHDKDNLFIPQKIDGKYALKFYIDNENKIKFEINHTPKMSDSYSFILAAILLYTIILAYKITYLYFQYSSNIKRKYLAFLLSSLSIFVILLFLQKLLFLSSSNLFAESCLLPDSKFSFSLAELAEFTILFFFNVIAFTKNIKIEFKLRLRSRILLSAFLFVSILLIYTYLIVLLISNINIHFSFLQIFNTDIFSYIFLIIVCILTSSVIILLQNVISISVNEKSNHERRSTLKLRNIIRNIVIITLMSIQLTYIFYLINENKEKEEMSWFATIIGDESDPDFEDEILKVTKSIKEDHLIREWQTNNDFPSDDSIMNYLTNKYLNKSQIKTYHKSLTLCDTSTILVVNGNEDYEVNCNKLFQAIFSYNMTKQISDDLIQIDDPTTDAYYILKLDLSPIDTNYHNVIYLEFYKEYILSYIGAPDIINSQANVILPNLHNYSFSSYHDGILQYKYGHYNYPNELESFRHKDEEYVKTRIFKHFVKKFDDGKTAIVTIEKPRFIDIIAPFSYIFIVLMIMYYLYVRIDGTHNLKFVRHSFHGKMQLVILLTLGFSFLVVGVTSFAFMRNSLNDRNFEFQYEKNKSIIKNIEDSYDRNIDIKDPAFLRNFKDIYFVDINIYDTIGSLINTTQPKLFDGFKSKIINKEAYESIMKRNRFFYSTQEYIDDTKYNSSYFPLKNIEGDIVAIINIPYFEYNNVGKNNMSYFIVTYFNIILVLLGLSALVVILMTRRTIKPLQMIQDKMQKISLGATNEAIDWQSDDEIGDLIEIYNKLIKELEISANQLMRSERETAWREMARQVAHEIKNPLTPMKLNIQFLQMAWNENNPDIDRKFRETTQSLLEQIEILSSIATAFSDYAKLPKNNIEEFNLKDLILNTINLYDNNNNIKIDFIEENDSDYIINSDKNNLSIVFGNILKNAVQAIGKKENGKITFKIKDLSTKYHIELSDNGCGIREEEKKKIFMPNFTTKSSGMGVGLSIVYDILQTLNGEITFNSEFGVGTTFIVEIKK